MAVMTKSLDCPKLTPMEAPLRGVLAGAVGTLAMDLLWFYRYKRGGGQSSFVQWEFANGLDDWSKASAPGQLGKRVFEGVFQHELAPRWAALTTDFMHWSYGMAWGGMYGVLAGSTPRPRILWGLPFALVVW